MENLLQNINIAAVKPPLILAVFAMALLLISAFSRRGRTAHIAGLSLVALAVTAVVNAGAWNAGHAGFAGHVTLDNFAVFFNFIILLAAGLAVFMSDPYLQREGYPLGEYYVLILFASVGGMFMASGSDLMTIFLGLELLSVCLYVLAGFFRGQLRSNEAGLKYFLLGAFSTGFLLYGIALTYGVTGTTNIVRIGNYLARSPEALASPMAVAGMLLMAAGFLFKVAIVPFHVWTPDVYEGAPTPVTAFMSAGPKAAAFAALVRVFVMGVPDLRGDWAPLFALLAVLTMFVGNTLAIGQKNLKRMLAYSSIAHAGYALVGLVAANRIGLAAILYYLLAYTFMNLGAFTVLTLAGRQGEENLTLEGMSGFGYKRPWLGVAMTVCLFSLMGIPPTAGFAGKFYLFAGAVEAGYVWLAILGVLNSAISLYYYLRVMVHMYFRAPAEEYGWVRMHAGSVFSMVFAVAGVLYLGLLPAWVMDLAAQTLF